MSDKIFENYDEAQKHSFSVPWKLETCNVGESCWCRIIAPVKPIKYKRDIPIDLLIRSSEIIDEIDYIIPDGSIDKETAEYFLELHNDKLKENNRVIKSESFPIPPHIQDAMAKAIRDTKNKE